MSCVSDRVSMWISRESRESFELECSGRPDLQASRRRRSVVLYTTTPREIVSEDANLVELRKQTLADLNREREESSSEGERKEKSQTEGQAQT